MKGLHLRPIRLHHAYLVACLIAAVVPLAAARDAQPAPVFTGWPDTFDGRPLRRLPDPPEEQAYYRKHPIEHARFSDGERTLLLRWVGQDMGAFHLSEPCFVAHGYRIGATHTRRGPDGRQERCFMARRKGRRVQVCEHIRDADGRAFPTFSAWARARLLKQARAPFLGVSVIEQP